MKKFYEKPLKPVAKEIGKLVSPMAITLLSIPATMAAAWMIYKGNGIAWLFLLAAGMLDLLDGMVARASGRATAFGDFFDAMIDRINEAAIYLSFMLSGHAVPAFLAMASSLLFSYSAARAEVWTIGKKIRYEGLGSRWQRIAILSASLALSAGEIGLWAIFLISSLGLVQRIFITWRVLHGKD